MSLAGHPLFLSFLLVDHWSMVWHTMVRKQCEIILIAAMAANRVIGRDNRIPWNIPGEQHHFRKVTWGHPLIMGRKTWESIGHPLPGRRNIVVTRDAAYSAPGAETAPSLAAALERCSHLEKVFVIGGGRIYEQALPQAHTLILTILARPVAGDVRFPEFSENGDFQLVSSVSVHGAEKYVINTYRRTGVSRFFQADP